MKIPAILSALLGSILIVSLAVNRSLADDSSVDSQAAIETCISAVGLKDAASFQSYCPANQTDETLTEQYKQVAYCIMSGFDILLSDGTVDVSKTSVMVSASEESEMLETANKCTLQGQTFDTLADKAYAILDCYRTDNATLYLPNCENYIALITSDLFDVVA